MKSIGIKTITLVFLITGAIDSIRNLPATALFGTSLFFFFFVSAFLFLIPVALISATLSACWPQHGGIYAWVKRAFGEKVAFMAIWLQWVNTLIWLPTILSFLAGTSAYLINPALASNKYYLISVMLLLNILLTWINLKGIHVSARISSICAIIGTMLPVAFIIILGCVWLATDKPLQLHLSWSDLVPHFSETSSWISLTAIITSFLGTELATVHIKDVHDPQRTFPRALAISVFLVMTTIFFSALTIAFVLPIEQIGLVNGIAETFSYFLQAFHLAKWLPYIIVMMLIGSFGGIISWIISPTKGLLQAVEFGYLPPFFAKLNQCGAPKNLLYGQAIITFILSFLFLVIPSINSIYWLLTDLSTQLYVLMYVLMFVAALALTPRVLNISGVYKIPGKAFGYILTCLLGLIGCTITLIVGFFTPSNMTFSTTIPYYVIFGSAMVLMILPVLGFYKYHSISRKIQNTDLEYSRSLS
jgi:glutamate:GABA antiporter